MLVHSYISGTWEAEGGGRWVQGQSQLPNNLVDSLYYMKLPLCVCLCMCLSMCLCILMCVLMCFCMCVCWYRSLSVWVCVDVCLWVWVCAVHLDFRGKSWELVPAFSLVWDRFPLVLCYVCQASRPKSLLQSSCSASYLPASGFYVGYGIQTQIIGLEHQALCPLNHFSISNTHVYWWVNQECYLQNETYTQKRSASLEQYFTLLEMSY